MNKDCVKNKPEKLRNRERLMYRGSLKLKDWMNNVDENNNKNKEGRR